MLTIINDEYDFKKLECQYYEVCKGYEPKKCLFGKPCHNNDMRSKLSILLEEYVGIDCLEHQIKLNDKP